MHSQLSDYGVIYRLDTTTLTEATMAVQEKFIGALVLYEKYRQLESHMPMARWGSSCRLKTPMGTTI